MNMINWYEYLSSFEDILSRKLTKKPYDNEAYIEYVKLNKSRMNRWLRTGLLKGSTQQTIEKISEVQNWYIITEPWCGDAAHSVPFIYLLSELNQNIKLTLILRDSEPEWIERYLTNGSRSIPKLIVRNNYDEDLFTWGPRPKECQLLISELKKQHISDEDIKTRAQEWYNKNKGISLQEEIRNKIELHLNSRS